MRAFLDSGEPLPAVTRLWYFGRTFNQLSPWDMAVRSNTFVFCIEFRHRDFNEVMKQQRGFSWIFSNDGGGGAGSQLKHTCPNLPIPIAHDLTLTSIT